MEGCHWSPQVHHAQLSSCGTHKVLPRLVFWASQACIQTARYIVAVWAWDCGEWECLSEFLAAGGDWRRHITRTRRRLAGPSAAILPTSARDQEDPTLQVFLQALRGRWFRICMSARVVCISIMWQVWFGSSYSRGLYYSKLMLTGLIRHIPA